MTNEERDAKIAEIEGRAEQFAASTFGTGAGATLLEDMAWLVGQIGEVRAATFEEAAQIADAAREDAEGDVRVVRDRLRAAARDI